MATTVDEAVFPPDEPGEESALLGNPEPVEQTEPKEQSLYWQEFKGLINYGSPLLLTQVLQFSNKLILLVFVGRLGTDELGATALGMMTVAITGHGALIGFGTSLDTVMAEAWGSGKPHLVGLYAQRVYAMMLLICIPVAVLWVFSEPLLALIIKGDTLVILTAGYIRVSIASLPGFALYEVVKRYMRCQGSIQPIFWSLVATVPIHAVLCYVFIMKTDLGVEGAAAAMAISQTLRGVVVVIYASFSKARQCWNGFQRRALQNWWPVIMLAIPDLIMVEVDILSWEIITLAASYLSAKELAAQTALGSIMGFIFQVPFPYSIAASFQIATAIGAKQPRRAKVATIIAITLGSVIGIIDMILLIIFRYQVPRLFTTDSEVVVLAAKCMALLGVVQLFDSTSVMLNGILRGLGRQKIGSYAMTSMYYIVGLPISIGTCFGLDWRLNGLWVGILLGVFGTSVIDSIALWWMDYDKCVERSAHRSDNA